MDIFRQKRYLWFAVILLIIMNLATLTLLWTGRPAGRRPSGGHQDPIKEQKRIEQLMKKELGFDKQQVEQYLKMRQEQREKVFLLQNEIRQIKKQMFDEVLEDVPQPMLSDSLLRLSQDKMVELEELTFKYLLDLKKLCRPDQQHNLKLLINEFFRQNPPQRMSNDGPSKNKGNNHEKS